MSASGAQSLRRAAAVLCAAVLLALWCGGGAPRGERGVEDPGAADAVATAPHVSDAPRLASVAWQLDTDATPLVTMRVDDAPPTIVLRALLQDGRCVAGAPGITWGAVACSLAEDEAQLPTVTMVERVPLALDYDNTQPCPDTAPACNAIRYEERVLRRVPPGAPWKIAVDDLVNTTQPGTRRIAARADGAKSDPGGQIVVRLDDSYVGWASELVGLPFVYYPMAQEGMHQTDARQGADCVATVIYGRRRAGEKVPYMAPSALARLLEPVRGGVRRGDVLHFGFQTAILAEDNAPIGQLDGNDRVLHAYHERVELAALGALPYGRFPVRVMRWPAAE